MNEKGKPLLPFRPDDTSENRILVTKSYDDTFHRLLNLRQRDRGKRRGVVLTGQPGTGASLWPPYPHLARQLTSTPVLQGKLPS